MSAQFAVRILASEGPLDGAPLGVAILLPRLDFAGQCGFVREATVEALAVERSDFDFGHVQPTAMGGDVMEFDAPQQPRSPTFPEDFLEHHTKWVLRLSRTK